jgi:uncharacterized membrane protein (UPF0182 family)
VIDVEWWKELGQLDTWLSMLTYSVAPVIGAMLIAFAILWVTHARALKFAGISQRDYPLYARVSALVLLVIGYMIASSCIDNWTVVRWAGSRGLPPSATGFVDSIFQKPLSFYLFDLPFYNLFLTYAFALAVVCLLLYWIAGRAWQLRSRLDALRNSHDLDISVFALEGARESKYLRTAGVLVLLIWAADAFFDRFQMVYNEHGSFLVGLDWLDQNVKLPLQWLVILSLIAAAGALLATKWRVTLIVLAAMAVRWIVPAAVSTLYVKPNEISLERPYIQAHIHATRAAFGIEQHVREAQFPAQPDAPIDLSANRSTLDNVRLWDTQAYHDTITQIQALRPYYTFHNIDVDRYTIENQYRQVLIAPRELDISQLPAARSNWINPAFIYTHGYGLVMSEVSKVTADGLPVLTIGNAPPEIRMKGLKLTRPELYYGEVEHEPIYVHTAQPEFNYPSGEDYTRSRYEGTGGIPISSFAMRLAAALREGEPNIILTDYLTENSRMVIRRRVSDRLQTLAGFLTWDPDPYLVVTDAGRLVWMIDGYTTSEAHPNSRPVDLGDMGRANYIRNAVKATIDAYDGETRLYVFAPDDPIINAYRNLFPKLFRSEAEMPADLRAHARYPETLFRVQAEIYRTYHMLDPQSFYNKEDLWDVAHHSGTQGGGVENAEPTYVVASLPGETTAEFLLILPFTPRNKDNLIGLMAARCDGAHLGEIVVLQLSKQELIFGPMQITARINQDQNISKDLSLWSQQGSQVLRGQILVLPAGNTFLYVDPIYIQATQAKMPQLKKVVLAVGNRLIYSDTYEEALAELGGTNPPPRAAPAPNAPGAAAPVAPPPVSEAGALGDRIRAHFQRYKELVSQGKMAEAGKELDAIEAAVKK